MDLRDKNVLVTGGAHRVGKALSLAFAGAGANVIVNYHTSAAAAHETVEEIEALGVRGLACQADVGELAAVQSMVESATAALGSIQLLIHSASPWIRNPFPEASPDIWQQVVNVTLNGAFYCAHSLAPQMLEAGEGAIVNIVDTSVTAPYYGMSAHTAAKSGLLALTRSLALELAPAVRVNAVSPGPVLPPDGFSEAAIARSAKRTLLGRWGSPQDVAQAALYLVRAPYVTGEVIQVDGGATLAHLRP